MSRTLAWESERKKPFLYDGARLVAVLEEHKHARLRQEEERRRLRVRYHKHHCNCLPLAPARRR